MASMLLPCGHPVKESHEEKVQFRFELEFYREQAFFTWKKDRDLNPNLSCHGSSLIVGRTLK